MNSLAVVFLLVIVTVLNVDLAKTDRKNKEKLSKQDKAILKSVFNIMYKAMDTNEDGFITLAEIMDFHKENVGGTFEGAMVGLLLNEADDGGGDSISIGDGKINRKEFKKFARTIMKEQGAILMRSENAIVNFFENNVLDENCKIPKTEEEKLEVINHFCGPTPVSKKKKSYKQWNGCSNDIEMWYIATNAEGSDFEDVTNVNKTNFGSFAAKVVSADLEDNILDD